MTPTHINILSWALPALFVSPFVAVLAACAILHRSLPKTDRNSAQ